MLLSQVISGVNFKDEDMIDTWWSPTINVDTNKEKEEDDEKRRPEESQNNLYILLLHTMGSPVENTWWRKYKDDDIIPQIIYITKYHLWSFVNKETLLSIGAILSSFIDKSLLHQD